MISNSRFTSLLVMLVAILGLLVWNMTSTMHNQATLDNINTHVTALSNGSNYSNGLISSKTDFSSLRLAFTSRYPKSTIPIAGQDNTVWGYSINPDIVTANYTAGQNINVANALNAANEMIFYVAQVNYQDKKDRCPPFCDVEGCSNIWQALSNNTNADRTSVASQITAFQDKYTSLPKGFTINRAYYDDIKAQAGCEYVRAYFGFQVYQTCVLLVGVKNVGGTAVEMTDGKMYFQDARSMRF
ncbi:MAG: hypothetical protein JSS82_11830 [Bacteroidetes bacterium]|nr:hypothetical protein [Bacteroidota bacterium]